MRDTKLKQSKTDKRQEKKKKIWKNHLVAFRKYASNIWSIVPNKIRIKKWVILSHLYFSLLLLLFLVAFLHGIIFLFIFLYISLLLLLLLRIICSLFFPRWISVELIISLSCRDSLLWLIQRVVIAVNAALILSLPHNHQMLWKCVNVCCICTCVSFLLLLFWLFFCLLLLIISRKLN